MCDCNGGVGMVSYPDTWCNDTMQRTQKRSHGFVTLSTAQSLFTLPRTASVFVRIDFQGKTVRSWCDVHKRG
eukprot:m.1021795 g.1021795  ORF g.1021795 m.1021795 type:complete len:72 (+) comp24095_c0_seq29:1852-2067(+)